mgnify:CR=1 FL=1|tara:strand:+ start:204 stop:605 length:402 start_codon:yes stop_codon:yes gene_type:complete
MKSISKLKKELDKWFSLYIRLRSSENGLVQCFTCGVVKHYKSGMQCGHFQSRRFMATRYDERNQIQCIKCNMFEQGMQWQFGLNLDAKYGEGTAEEMQFKARQIQKFSRVDYEDKITYYKSLVENLKKEKGIE